MLKNKLSRLSFIAFGLMAFGITAPAAMAADNPINVPATVTVVRALDMTLVSGLRFGNVALINTSAAGHYDIAPDGTETTNGNLTRLATTPANRGRAVVQVDGFGDSAYTVSLPNGNAINLTGNSSVRVEDIRVDNTSQGLSSNTDQFFIGGKLIVEGNFVPDNDTTLSASFPVRVQYQ